MQEVEGTADRADIPEAWAALEEETAEQPDGGYCTYASFLLDIFGKVQKRNLPCRKPRFHIDSVTAYAGKD